MPAGDAGLEWQPEVDQLREQVAEWESAQSVVAELRGLIESHMDMARGQWRCVAQLAAQQAVVDAARLVVASSPSWGWIQENGGVMPRTERLNMTVTLGPFAQLADALDKAQAAQPEGER